MDDNEKSKALLIKELKSLRRRFAILEKKQYHEPRSETDKKELELFLQERVKELTCLYGMTELIEKHGNSFDLILQGIADLIPSSWQYPEITSTRIVFDTKKFTSENYKKSRWRQSADVEMFKKKIGSVEVFYSEKRPDSVEGPFLKDERLLINAICERIGRVAERIRAGQELEAERLALKNMNIALKEVLTKIQDEKNEIGRALQDNVDKIIMPIVYSIEDDMSSKQRGYIELLKQFLGDITSPYISNLSNIFFNLTAAELQICNMIRSGLSTKEIAKLRGVSFSTVSRQREHIRKKLGIMNKDINLHSYLQANPVDKTENGMKSS